MNLDAFISASLSQGKSERELRGQYLGEQQTLVTLEKGELGQMNLKELVEALSKGGLMWPLTFLLHDRWPEFRRWYIQPRKCLEAERYHSFK